MKRYLVYFWETENGQFVKIGCCQGNLYKRRIAIQIGCPLPLCKYPAGVIVCEDKDKMRKVERTTQKQFKAFRTQGEWFTLTDEICEYIQEFTDTKLGKAFVDEGREHQRESFQANPEYRERQREWHREYNARPEVKERQREYNARPEVKERQREYNARPEVKERRREREKERLKDPEKKERRRKYQREWQRGYEASPEVRKRKRERDRKRYARKKREALLENGQQMSLFEGE